MSKIIKFAKVLRRNWKKSTFFFGVLAYGASYGIERYQTFEMMRAYCEEAKKYGEQTLPAVSKPKHVTVILNPEANNKKSNAQYEKFAAPLLHLAGFKVSLFQTENEKQAQDLMQVMSNTDAVIVAGGNGTLHEVVTGLMRRSDKKENRIPLGIVPLGKKNSVASSLFGSMSSSQAQMMAESVMAVIRETTTALDVLKVQFAPEKEPVYGVSSFEQGVISDVEPLVEKKWYLGPLKSRFVYFIHSLKEWKPIENVSVEYVQQCSGCSRCALPPKKNEKQQSRWWQAFIPKRPEDPASEAEYRRRMGVTNEECGKQVPLCSAYSNICVSANASDRSNDQRFFWIKTFPEKLSVIQFISTGLSHLSSKSEDSSGLAEIATGRQVIIEDKSQDGSEETEMFSYVDNEKYKRSSCSIELMPREVTVYA